MSAANAARRIDHREGGFTLVELLVYVGIISIFLGLGAFAARQLWFTRSLTGAHDEIATQLRALQTRVISEGVTTRYYGGYFDATDNTLNKQWGTVRYESSTSTCTRIGNFRLDAGVEIDQVNFSDTGSGGISVSTAITNCRTQLGLPASTDFVFFFARGTATESVANLRLIQPRRDDETEEIRVLGLTARVEKV